MKRNTDIWTRNVEGTESSADFPITSPGFIEFPDAIRQSLL